MAQPRCRASGGSSTGGEVARGNLSNCVGRQQSWRELWTILQLNAGAGVDVGLAGGELALVDMDRWRKAARL